VSFRPTHYPCPKTEPHPEHQHNEGPDAYTYTCPGRTLSPAEVLAAAADKLDALLAETAPDWRLSESNHLALPLIEMPYMNGMLKGQPGYTLSDPNDATTFYIAAMNPLVGNALAKLLRQEAEAMARSARFPGFDGVTIQLPNEEMLALARLIIGGES